LGLSLDEDRITDKNPDEMLGFCYIGTTNKKTEKNKMTISKTTLVASWVRDLQIDEKYEYLLTTYSWSLDGTGRPKTDNRKRNDGTRKFEGFADAVYIYQLIKYLEHGKKSNVKRQVRHLNHNVLDNRVENLAFGTARDNSLDHIEKTCVRQMPSGKWRTIAHLGNKKYSGRSRETREEALLDYQKMVKDFELHNIIPTTRQDRRNLPEYLMCDHNSKINPYVVRKWNGSRMVHYGRYPTVENAVAARDRLIANNWTSA
jgi:hypothetical protein